MAIEIKLPELGENIESGDVAAVLVKKGDRVEKDAPLVELETDKAVVEVPATDGGVVTAVHVKAGETVSVGQAIVSLEPGDGESGATDGEAQASEAKASEAKASEAQASEAKASGAQASEAQGADKPGDGTPKAEADNRSATLAAGSDGNGAVTLDDEQEEAGAADADADSDSAPAPAAARQQPASPATAADGDGVRPIPATPAVRRLAREIGVDITVVTGSGPAGRILLDDVKATAKQLLQGGAAGAPAGAVAGVPLPDFAKWGQIERTPMNAVRRKTAEHLSAVWHSVPTVTQQDKADITDLERLRKQFGYKAEAAGGKLTVTAILVKVVAAALKVFPQFNASVDPARAEIITKSYYNIGIAVDTERGLLVPVIRDVDQMNILQIAAALSDISARARERKITPDEMQGGTFSISNLGGIGGSHFTPIVNAPEVAILGVSRAQQEPVLVDGAFVPRLRLPLSLSYDHRLIDGADGIRFLRWVVEALEQPLLLALEG